MKIARYVYFTFFVLFTVLLSFTFATTGDADAVFINITKEYTLNSDGSTEFRYSHKVKLLTYLTVNRYFGETFIVYNPEFQKLRVTKSVTTMADGKEVSSPENAFNEVLPGFVAGAPVYQHLREMVITHTGLERGCVIELEYQITSKPGFIPYLMGEEIFGVSSPIEEMTVIVRLPKDRNLSYELLNGNISPKLSTDAQFHTFNWTKHDIPILRNEPHHQPNAEFALRLVFSTCPSWNELSEFLQDRVQGKLSLNDKAKIWIDKAKEDLTDNKAMVLKLREIVADQVGTIRCDPKYFGYRFQGADNTFSNNYGHAWDKALLLMAVLRKAGFTTHQALLSRYGQIAPSVPSLQQFDEAWVAVKGLGDDLFYLNPGGNQNKRAEYSQSGRMFFLPEKRDNPLITLIDRSVKENCQRVTANLILSEEFILSGDVQLQTRGYFHPGFDLMEGQDGFVKKKLTKMFGKGEVSDIMVKELGENDGAFTAQFEATNAFEDKEGFVIWTLTIPSSFDDLHISAALSKRFTPLQLPTRMSESVDLTVELPKNLRVFVTPTAVDMENEIGMLRIKSEIKEGKLRINRQLVLNKKIISPLEYQDFREMIVEWQAPDSRNIVFKKLSID